MKIKFLKAEHGDSILISIPKGNKNILIDGGPGNSYVERNRRTQRYEDKALKNTIAELIGKGEYIDLLILTHVDDDHIGGLITWFESLDFKPDYIKEVWFNSGQSIFKFYKNEKNTTNNRPLNTSDNNRNTGINQGDTFESYIEKHKIWDKTIIKAGQSHKRFGAEFIILSPTDKELERLLTKWKKESSKPFTGSKKDDYKSSISQLLKDDSFKSDRSKHNGSSIAFILKHEDNSYLFLGDAFAGVICNELRKLKHSKMSPLNCALVKISHHGSKANTSNMLLDLIKSDNYVISANGQHHNLPNKKCLARIIDKNPKANLLFNYPQLISKIFSKDELENCEFNAVEVDKLDFN